MTYMSNVAANSIAKPITNRMNQLFLTALFLNIGVIALAQTHSAQPSFEVASIKPSKSDERGTYLRRQPGGLYRATNVPLRALIASAYLNQFPPKGERIVGGPGWIDTDMTEGVQANEKFMANVVPRIPFRRFGRAKDFAGIAVYLASDESDWVTGSVLPIDGGYLAV